MLEEKRLEVEYIISLTILVLTFLAVPYLRELVEPLVAQAFLLLVSLHIVLFNIDYIFKVADFKFPVIQKLELIGRITLVMVFLGFVYIFFHILCMSLALDKLKSILIPIFVVVGLTIGIVQKILKPYLILRNVKILIAPEKIDIYSDYDDTEPLFIKIENGNKKEEIKAEIRITFPDDVLYNIEYDGIYDRRREYSREIELPAKRVWMRNISMKYEGNKTKRDVIDVKIFVDNNLYEKVVEAVLKVQ
ncbi:hypothetical protein DRP04_05825 [Archaeoglobales archaeon]|mgnify:CR=1 FL=1|nr:MAG: hypothetical protein DRP04_05825 [Archaeoglobales archaeon]